jgi:putative transposase
VLVFLEIGSRRVIFCNATAHPDSAWVAQQARNVAWELEELKIPITVLMRDRDSKYSSDFEAVFSAAGIRIARTRFRTPTRQRRLRAGTGLPAARVSGLIILGAPPGPGPARVLRPLQPGPATSCLGPQPARAQPIPERGVIVRMRRLHGFINEYSRAA